MRRCMIGEALWSRSTVFRSSSLWTTLLLLHLHLLLHLLFLFFFLLLLFNRCATEMQKRKDSKRYIRSKVNLLPLLFLLLFDSLPSLIHLFSHDTGAFRDEYDRLRPLNYPGTDVRPSSFPPRSRLFRLFLRSSTPSSPTSYHVHPSFIHFVLSIFFSLALFSSPSILWSPPLPSSLWLRFAAPLSPLRVTFNNFSSHFVCLLVLSLPFFVLPMTLPFLLFSLPNLLLFLRCFWSSCRFSIRGTKTASRQDGCQRSITTSQMLPPSSWEPR